MDKDREQKVLASLYDRLFDAVTYSPEGKSGLYSKNEIYFHMDQNHVLEPKDFEDMISPVNPNGNMKSTSAFSAMVDVLPKPSVRWDPGLNKLSKAYEEIVNGANTGAKPRPEQEKIYKQASDFLRVEKKVKEFDGSETTQIEPTSIAVAYDNAEAAYITALGGYRTAYNGYDLDKKEDQRAWNAVEPGLQLNLNNAWNNWTRQGKAQVEKAQNALASSINDAISSVIRSSQRLVSDEFKSPPLAGEGKWLRSYALPTSWASASAKGSKLKFTSAYLNKTESSVAQKYSAELSASWGLWHGSAKASGGNKEENKHMDAQNFTLEAELITVSIMRPWFNPLLFTMNQWFVEGYEKNQISNADAANLKGIMPLVPVGLVIARDVKISADFSEEDKKTISSQLDTEASFGWGPFGIKGGYSRETSSSEMKTKFDGATLQLPGLQVIAWISSITPASPPQSAPASATAGR